MRATSISGSEPMPSAHGATDAKRAAIVAVIVTRNRPALLSRCLRAIAAQSRPPTRILVVDDAGHVALEPIVAGFPSVRLLTLRHNQGPAAAYGIGITAALAEAPTHIWLMDDDGAPAGPDCLARLFATASREAAHITCPLVSDIDRPDRLAFPIRQRGRTRFTAAAIDRSQLIRGFAHLFNGALIDAGTFGRIGLPNAALFIRGDEVEFMLRAKRAGLRIVTDTRIAFLHPSSISEIHPILGGRFHAVVPSDPAKQHCQFRNRGWIFRRYGMWGWLAADHVRYACLYLGERRDLRAYATWLSSTWAGVAGHIGPPQPLEPGPALMREAA